MYKQISEALRAAYDQKVDEREVSKTQEWKAEVRHRFLERLRDEGKRTLLDVGAGTGVHSLFFKNAGLAVVSTDLSRAMVESCRAKGLNALQLDFLSLDFEEDFDAVFALNCLLHVPPGELQAVLAIIRRALRPSGLFFWGQYGGVNHEGPLENDRYEPSRYFSMLTDEALLAAGSAVFQLVGFETVQIDRGWDQHFQASVWRAPGDSEPLRRPDPNPTCSSNLR